MTEFKNTTKTCNILHIPSKEEFHKHFGGIIYQSDFNTDYRGHDNTHGSFIARRIEYDNSHFTKLKKVDKYD